jgi:sterol desaturase/sphingolipid hydroxylase (fatty acid hydroxylase superfamily)
VADLQATFLDVLRVGYPGVTLGSLLFLLVWEGDRPRDVVPRRARHVLRNLALFAVMVIVADGLVGSVVLRIDRHLLDVPRGLLTPLEWPLGAMVVAGVFATDFASYALHLLSHRWRGLWLFHAVHHSDPQLDATTGLRFHPVDMAFYVAGVAGTGDPAIALRDLGIGVDLFVNAGTLPLSPASTLLDMDASGKVTTLRAGAIPEADLQGFF